MENFIPLVIGYLITGIIIGILIVLATQFKRIFKPIKYSYHGLPKYKPTINAQVEKFKTVDGSNAVKDFKR